MKYVLLSLETKLKIFYSFNTRTVLGTRNQYKIYNYTEK